MDYQYLSEKIMEKRAGIKRVIRLDNSLLNISKRLHTGNLRPGETVKGLMKKRKNVSKAYGMAANKDQRRYLARDNATKDYIERRTRKMQIKGYFA